MVAKSSPMLRIPVLAAIAKVLLGSVLAGPNVVVVITDEPVPPLLAGESTSLERHFASLTPVATRAALLTGQHEFHCGVSHVAAGRTLLRPGVPTMAEMFRTAGYRTGIFGTWGLGEAFPCRPEDRGFDEICVHGGETPGDTPDFWGNDGGMARRKEGWEKVAMLDASVLWMKARLAEKQPFFLWVSLRSGLAGLLKAIEGTDTILVVTRSWTGRPGLSDAGTRVPCLIRWPGKIPIGKPVAALTSPLDLLPTLSGLSGIKRPAGWTGEGEDLSAALLGSGAFPADRLVFTQAGGWSGDEAAGRFRGRDFSVRDPRWRLTGLELFDTQGNADENVFQMQPQEFQRLLTGYGRWWERVLPLLREPVRYEIGSESAPVTRLTAFDWWPSKEADDVHGATSVINQGQIRTLLKSAQVAATRNSLPSTSGHWKLHAAREGNYEVTFSLLPPEAPAEDRRALGQLRAGTAHIRAGQEEVKMAVQAGATSLTVPLDLDAGPVDLEVWFDGQLLNDRILGAFFVSVERKGERKVPKLEFKPQPAK
jgi:hypothetical protein